jgi:hypothetical protein
MGNGMDDHRLDWEIADLHAEIETVQKNLKSEVEKAYDQKLANRHLPPMSQMTRVQKRYFLEPWMTTFCLVSGGIALLCYLLGIFLPGWLFGGSFLWAGGIFTLVGAGFLTAKLFLMQWNSKTEGSVQNGPHHHSDSFGY